MDANSFVRTTYIGQTSAAARESQDNPQEDRRDSRSSSRKGVWQIMRFHSMVFWLKSSGTRPDFRDYM